MLQTRVANAYAANTHMLLTHVLLTHVLLTHICCKRVLLMHMLLTHINVLLTDVDWLAIKMGHCAALTRQHILRMMNDNDIILYLKIRRKMCTGWISG